MTWVIGWALLCGRAPDVAGRLAPRRPAGGCRSIVPARERGRPLPDVARRARRLSARRRARSSSSTTVRDETGAVANAARGACPSVRGRFPTAGPGRRGRLAGRPSGATSSSCSTPTSSPTPDLLEQRRHRACTARWARVGAAVPPHAPVVGTRLGLLQPRGGDGCGRGIAAVAGPPTGERGVRARDGLPARTVPRARRWPAVRSAILEDVELARSRRGGRCAGDGVHRRPRRRVPHVRPARSARRGVDEELRVRSPRGPAAAAHARDRVGDRVPGEWWMGPRRRSDGGDRLPSRSRPSASCSSGSSGASVCSVPCSTRCSPWCSSPSSSARCSSPCAVR